MGVKLKEYPNKKKRPMSTMIVFHRSLLIVRPINLVAIDNIDFTRKNYSPDDWLPYRVSWAPSQKGAFLVCLQAHR